MKSDELNIAAIVLAAGEGKRLSRTKGLIEIDGVSFLQRVVGFLKDGGVESIIVVGGANAGELKQAAENLGVDFALNTEWQTGQFSSLKIGIRSLTRRPHGLLVALVDHPLVKPQTCSKLLEAFSRNPQKVYLPVHEEKKGHPIIIPREIIKEIEISSSDSNLRQIIGKHHELVVELPVDDAGILRDIDTISDLKGIKPA
jgi:CTP:molybdopterin cytidylyltransferase MocA